MFPRGFFNIASLQTCYDLKFFAIHAIWFSLILCSFLIIFKFSDFSMPITLSSISTNVVFWNQSSNDPKRKNFQFVGSILSKNISVPHLFLLHNQILFNYFVQVASSFCLLCIQFSFTIF
jgi:hypothetical protein